MAKKVKQAPPEPKPTRIEFETFRPVDSYWVGQLRQDKPSCFNGVIEVRKYRVVVELVDEPLEVIGARLQELWDTCDNWHHHEPLRFVAKKLGWELKGEFGSRRKKDA